MRILEKHVLKEFVTAFAFAMCVFAFLFIIIDSFTRLADFAKSQTELATIAQFYASTLPTIFVQCAPLATLLAMVYTMGKLNYNNELIAMRSGGLSIYRIIAPIITTGVVLSVATFLISERITPASQESADMIKNEYIEKDERADEVLTNLAIYGFSNRLFYIKAFKTKTNELEGLIILEHDNRQNVSAKISAQKTVWKNGHWFADKCYTYTMDENNRITDYQYRTAHVLAIEETPEDFLRQSRKISYMNSRQLLDYIHKLSSSSAETAIRNLYIDLYQKMVSPFTCFIMIFIGLPCSMAIRRKAVGFSSVGISVLVALLYYVFQAVAIALGKNNVFPVAASVMITPFIFVASSMYLVSVSS